MLSCFNKKHSFYSSFKPIKAI